MHCSHFFLYALYTELQFPVKYHATMACETRRGVRPHNARSTMLNCLLLLNSYCELVQAGKCATKDILHNTYTYYTYIYINQILFVFVRQTEICGGSLVWRWVYYIRYMCGYVTSQKKNHPAEIVFLSICRLLFVPVVTVFKCVYKYVMCLCVYACLCVFASEYKSMGCVSPYVTCNIYVCILYGCLFVWRL